NGGISLTLAGAKRRDTQNSPIVAAHFAHYARSNHPVRRFGRASRVLRDDPMCLESVPVLGQPDDVVHRQQVMLSRRILYRRRWGGARRDLRFTLAFCAFDGCPYRAHYCLLLSMTAPI